MFNPFRRKKKTLSAGWLWLLTALAAAVAIAAWVVVDVQWQMAAIRDAKLTALDRDNQAMAGMLHAMKQYESTSVGQTHPSCGVLAQIGTYAGDAKAAAPAIVEAMRKRDPKFTEQDIWRIEGLLGAVNVLESNPQAGIPGVAVRLPDGSVSWLADDAVRLGDYYGATISYDYQQLHRDQACGSETNRPELSTCVPSHVTLFNGGIYIGNFQPYCEATKGE